MSRNVAPGADGRRRQVGSGQFLGRFAYTEHTPDPEVRTHRTYLVHRISDGRFLGLVYHQLGTSWWTSQPAASATLLAGRRARREWAADELDADSRLHVWCACGLAAGAHDRPTRAAMRAWAAAYDFETATAATLTNAGRAARAAAEHARYRGRHYDTRTCVDHARAWATPPPPGYVRAVLPDTSPTQWVLIGPDWTDCRPAVRRYTGDRLAEEYAWPNRNRSVEQIQMVYEKRGYRPVFDWRG